MRLTRRIWLGITMAAIGVPYAAYLVWLFSQEPHLINGERVPPPLFGVYLSKTPWVIVHSIPVLILWQLLDAWKVAKNVVTGRFLGERHGVSYVAIEGFEPRVLPYNGPAAEFVWRIYVGSESSLPWESIEVPEIEEMMLEWVENASPEELVDLVSVAQCPDFFGEPFTDHGSLHQPGPEILGVLMGLAHLKRDVPSWSDLVLCLGERQTHLFALRAFEVLLEHDRTYGHRIAPYLKPFVDSPETLQPYAWKELCSILCVLGGLDALPSLRRLGTAIPPDEDDLNRAVWEDCLRQVESRLGAA